LQRPERDPSSFGLHLFMAAMTIFTELI